jgi:hypothetical protein
VLEVDDTSHKVLFVIVKGEKTAIVGLKSCNLLGLVKTGSNGEMTHVEDAYADVFQGRGKLKVQNNMELEHPHRPVIHVPRKVPFSLRDKLKAELLRLEASR